MPLCLYFHSLVIGRYIVWLFSSFMIWMETLSIFFDYFYLLVLAPGLSLFKSHPSHLYYFSLRYFLQLWQRGNDFRFFFFSMKGSLLYFFKPFHPNSKSHSIGTYKGVCTLISKFKLTFLSEIFDNHLLIQSLTTHWLCQTIIS